METVVVAQGLLRWARERAAATLVDAATHGDVSEAELSTWEEGTSEPQLTALRSLAHYYGIPLSAFLLPAPRADPRRPTDYRVFGAADGTPPRLTRLLALALNRAVSLQGVAGEVLRDEGRRPENLPELGEGSIESLASDHRASLGIEIAAQTRWRDAHTALRHWRAAIEQRGVVVMQFAMPRFEVRAFSLRGAPFVVVLNRSDWVRARIFSLVHEYAHLLRGTDGICLPGATRSAIEHPVEVETFCNRFAGAVLVPAQALTSLPLAREVDGANDVSDFLIEELASHFHVSRPVVWYRLHEVGFVSREVFVAKWNDWDDQFIPPPTGGGGMTSAEYALSVYGSRLPELLIHAVRRQIVTDVDVAQYLRVGHRVLSDIEDLVSARSA